LDIIVGRDDPARREYEFTPVFAGGTSGSPCPTWCFIQSTSNQI